jgi:uncharacterized Zn finger protein
MWEIHRFGLIGGGLGFGEAVPRVIVERATLQERHTVAEWVREAFPKSKGKDFTANWRLHQYGDLVLTLEGDLLDDVGYLKLCRQTGMRTELLERLLELGRVDEAVREAATVEDEDLLPLANILVRHGQEARAERLVRERLAETRDPQLPQWLMERAAAREDGAGVLPLAQQVFSLHPGLAEYREVRRVATAARRWKKERAALMSQLEGPRHHALRTEVFLDEDEIDRALAEVKNDRVPPDGHALALRVAEAAEKERPREAIALYRKHAEGLIGFQGRERYQVACRLLRRVKALDQQLGEEEEWDRTVATLRQKYARQRAFLEELNAAGL